MTAKLQVAFFYFGGYNCRRGAFLCQAALMESNDLFSSICAETNAIICAYKYILALERELVQICTQLGSGAASTRIT